MVEAIERLIDFNNDCIEIIAPILKKNEGHKLKQYSIDQLSIHYGQRMINSLQAVNQLLPFIQNTNFHSSIALTLRPSLLDLITFAYVVGTMMENRKSEIIKSIYADNIKNILIDFRMMNSTGDFSFKVYKSLVEIIAKKYDDLFIKIEFNEKGVLIFEFIELEQIPSVRKMYAKTKGNKKIGFSKMVNCFSEYHWFSKFEHFGLITLSLENAAYGTFELFVKNSCINIVRGALSCLSF